MTDYNDAMDSIKRFQTHVNELNPIKRNDVLMSLINQYQHQMDELCETLYGSIPPKLQVIYDEIGKALQTVDSQLQSVLADVELPSMDRKWLDERQKSYRRWGEYGWTMIDWAEIHFFYDCPASQKEANKKALSVCDNARMKCFLEELKAEKKIRKADLMEAIDDFNNKRYKSCACILFALIDGALIRSMKKPEKGNRPSGKVAAENINKKIDSTFQIKGMVFHFLTWLGVLSAINAFFAKGDDFKLQPIVLGRNWLDHGMLHREVKKMDCIQLFLLLSNLLKVKEAFGKATRSC